MNMLAARQSRDEVVVRTRARAAVPVRLAPSFDEQFSEQFDAQFHRLYGYLDKLSGDPDLAADLAQEAFVRLYRRGELPEAPAAWLITVATNLFRNERASRQRRRRLLTLWRGESAHSDPGPPPDQSSSGAELRRQVRVALNQLAERDGRILLLRAQGYSYEEIAGALALNPASVGVLLARAKRAFRHAYEERFDAP